MRSEDQIQDIIDRSKVGYILLQQTIPVKEEAGFLTDNQSDNLYTRLFRGRILLKAIQFEGLSLFRKNMIADNLVQYGFVAKSHASTDYLQMAYNNEITLITQ
jgi:hypothetical protein